MLKDVIALCCWTFAVLMTLVGFYAFVLGEKSPPHPLLIGAALGILLGVLTVRPLWYALVVVVGFALVPVFAFLLKSFTGI